MKTLPYFLITLWFLNLIYSCKSAKQDTIHVFEIKEIELQARKEYQNPYTDVECWIQLKGPGFDKRIYGFWDGGNIFRIRIAATTPGTWTWESGCNHPDGNPASIRDWAIKIKSTGA